jgi:hypothetical protein
MRKLIGLLLLAALAYGIYYGLDARRRNFIGSEGSDSYVIFDNPSSRALSILYGKDTFYAPPYTRVHFPVNSKANAGSRIHVRAWEEEGAKLVTDSELVMPGSELDYFINPSLSRYCKVVVEVEELWGYRADESYKPVGEKMLITKKVERSGDTVKLNSLVIRLKDAGNMLMTGESTEPDSLKGKTHWASLTYFFNEMPLPNGKKMKDVFYEQEWNGFLKPECRIVPANDF